ncbi:MAG: response regulator [Gammaproteobacteria bacterium]|nr:response regulator [Gammaproteobacteria bacterium]
MITLLIIDDHELIREGIRRLLEDQAHISVLAQAASGEEAIRLAAELKPEIILMDISMPGIGGLEATHRLLQMNPKQKIIIVTAHTADPFPKVLLRAGAVGYISKNSGLSEMQTAIEAIHQGKSYISPDIAQKLAIAALNPSSETPFDRLSQRELQIIMLISQGLRTQDIAKRLCLSPKTISTYRSRLMDKLSVPSVVELMKLAEQHGLNEQPSVS